VKPEGKRDLRVDGRILLNGFSGGTLVI
jgi:hypothetical protein